MTNSASQGVCAVLPAKNIGDAKQRLSGVLSAKHRRELFKTMLQDTLHTLASTRELEEVFVVTRDAHVTVAAKAYGFTVLREAENIGQTEAVTFAIDTLLALGKHTLLSVPADLPLITPRDLSAVIGEHQSHPSVTIVPARDHLGSNVILCSPPNALTLRFGDNSFYPHLASARADGIEPTVVHNRNIGLDIDTPADLIELIQRGTDCQALRYLATHDLIDKLTTTERTGS